MVGLSKQFQRRAAAERGAEWPDLIRHRKLVTCSLQEQHRNRHLEQMLAALLRRLAGSMQRESQECETTNARKRRKGLCLRGHAAPERFSAGEQRQLYELGRL